MRSHTGLLLAATASASLLNRTARWPFPHPQLSAMSASRVLSRALVRPPVPVVRNLRKPVSLSPTSSTCFADVASQILLPLARSYADFRASGNHDNPSSGSGSAARYTDPVTVTSVLSNGLSISTETIPGMSSSTVGLFIDAGSRADQTYASGAAHFLEVNNCATLSPGFWS